MRSCVALVCLLFLMTPAAHATVEGWETAGDPARVTFNYSSNHGYYSRELPYRLWHAASVLDNIRLDLVKNRKLENIPIVLRYPEKNLGSAEDQSHLLRGKTTIHDGDMEETLSRRRYEIYLGKTFPAADDAHFTTGILALIYELASIAKDDTAVPVKNLTALIQEHNAAIMKATARTAIFDPIWSPDGNQLAYTTWEGGKITFSVVSAAGRKVTRLEAPESYMAARPLWSADSRLLAYGDLKGVRVFDTDTGKTIHLKFEKVETGPFELGLNFTGQGAEAQLQGTFDTSLFFDYKSFQCNPVTGTALWQKTTPDRPTWFKPNPKEEPAGARKTAVSPDGKWSAKIVEVAGVPNLLIAPTKGGQATIDTGKLSSTMAQPSVPVAIQSPDARPTPAATATPPPQETGTNARYVFLLAAGIFIVGLVLFLRRRAGKPGTTR